MKEVVGLDPGADPIEHGDLIVEVNRSRPPRLAAYEKALLGLKPERAPGSSLTGRVRPAPSLPT